METDHILDKYLTKLNKSKNSNNKLLYYKKATKRLDELKKEYQTLQEIIQQKPSESESDLSIEKIQSQLNKINESIEEDENLVDLIQDYIKYKSLLDDLDSKTSQFHNEIYQVDLEELSIEPISMDDIV